MRNIKIDCLSTTWVKVELPGDVHLAVEVVDVVDLSDLEKKLLHHYDNSVSCHSDNEILDFVAKALWVDYNVVSISLGRTRFSGFSRIKLGCAKSFLREAETKVEGTEKIEVATET